MGRGKVQLKLIEKPARRNTVYRKRLEGLKKKAFELSTLCDIPAMIISYQPNGKVDTWPESKEEVHEIIKKYNSVGDKILEKNKHNSEGYILSQIEKKQKALNHIAMESREMLSGTINSLDAKLAQVMDRILLLRNQSYMEITAMPSSENMLEEKKLNIDDMYSLRPFPGARTLNNKTSIELLTGKLIEYNVYDNQTNKIWEQMSVSTCFSKNYTGVNYQVSQLPEHNQQNDFGLSCLNSRNGYGIGNYTHNFNEASTWNYTEPSTTSELPSEYKVLDNFDVMRYGYGNIQQLFDLNDLCTSSVTMQVNTDSKLWTSGTMTGNRDWNF